MRRPSGVVTSDAAKGGGTGLGARSTPTRIAGSGRDPAGSAVLLLDAGARPGAHAALAEPLARTLGEGWTVHTAVLDAGPRALDPATAVARILAGDAATLVVVPVSPHFDPAAEGRALAAVHGALARSGRPLALRTLPAWHDDAGYVDALARAVAEIATARDLSPADTHLRFVVPRPAGPGPRLPAWSARVARTVELVAERVGWPVEATSTGYPSAVESRAPGRRVLVCPLTPVPDPPPAGEGVHACAPLHTSPPFLAALKRLVVEGARPVPSGKRPPEPLLRARAPGADGEPGPEDGRLILLGASLRGVLDGDAGPRIRHSEPYALARVRKSHQDVGAFLGWVREATPVREAFLWNTCQRTELYAWLPGEWDADGRAAVLGRLRRALFGSEPEGLRVTVLEGAAARHHLLRTACGLNSDLPGDRDVSPQLQGALRRAWSAGMAARAAATLVEEALDVARRVNAETRFGDFSTGYCAAALRRVFEVDGLRPGSLRHVTIGGSTTSRSVLEALRTDHGVPPAQLTAVYRDHHGQMKHLRAAVGGGRRLRVHGYADERVLGAVADTDVVYLGIDQAEPVLETAALGGLRDFDARPLTLIDFNAFGSLGPARVPAGVRIWPAAELDDAVAAHAAITATRAGFAAALGEAEAWITRHLADRAPSSPVARIVERSGAV